MARVTHLTGLCLLFAALALAAPVRLQIHVTRVASETEIETEFVERSTPGHPKFRQHLSLPQLTKLVRGRPESVAAVTNFLRSHGAQDVALVETQDIVSAMVDESSPTAKAFAIPKRLFAGEDKLGRGVLQVPAMLAAHAVRAVAVAARSTAVKKHRRTQSKSGTPKLTEPGAVQTPFTIRQRYNVPGTDVNASAVQGVGEFQNSYFNMSWMTNFTQRYNITSPTTYMKVRGPNSPSSDDQEGPLDMQYMYAMAPGTTTWWISSNDTSSNPAGIDFAWWSTEVLKLDPMPTVVSLSWGLGEAQYYLQSQLMVADNDGFRKLGLVGVSVFVASGDSGPGGRSYMSCNHFDPSWPASSPYVTAVGATYADPTNQTEIAVRWSGGGFSDYFPRPAWQEHAVQNYLNTTGKPLPNSTFFNASGRAFPDVATLGTNFQVYGDEDGYGYIDWYLISGTSCASPTFAGIITRINSLRLSKGLSTLGFLNPALYQMGSIGYDVVDGYNLDDDCFGFPFGGFVTAKGWDPVTGLGTPKFDILIAGLVQK